MPKVVFLDTMIYLHFKPVEDIDWLGLLRTDQVRIIVPRITTSELDKHKDSHQNSKVKDRARRILQLLEGITAGERAILREGVEIERFRRRPTFDLGDYDLDPSRNDDVMVAAALEFRKENPDVEIVLVSGDATARMTASDLGLQAISLPEEFRVRGEVDPIEAENRELRKQLARLQNVLPKLSLRFQNAEPGNRMLIQLANLPTYPGDVIRKQLEEQSTEYPPYTPKETNPALPSIASMFHSPDEEEINRYTADREKYLRQYAKYLRDLWSTQCVRMLTFRIALELVNDGTAVAEDVDVHVHFPDGFKLLDGNEFEALEKSTPKPPSPPRSPRSTLEVHADRMAAITYLSGFPNQRDLSYLPNFRPVGPPPNVSRPNIQETGSYDVRWKVRQSKHKRTEHLDVLVGIFDSFDTASSFGITYRIHAANLPEEEEGELHVVVKKPKT